MTEQRQVVLTCLAFILLMGFGILYQQGGRAGGGGKWLRRFLGGTLLPTGTIGLALSSGTFTWWMLGSLLAYPAALTMGYGGTTRARIFWRRLLYGLCLGLASWPILLPLNPWIAGLQLVLSVTASVVYGLFSRQHAASEEAAIAVLSVVCVPLAVVS